VLSEGNCSAVNGVVENTMNSFSYLSTFSHTVTLGSRSVMFVWYFMSITITNRDTEGIFYFYS